MEIIIERLTKRFKTITAVDHLSITIEDGKLVALLGPSGCGKTTILNMLSGILPVTEGRIYFNGKDVTDLSPDKRNVGLVFQNYALYPHMTVLQNICFPLEIKRIPKKERITRAKELAELVQIPDLLKRYPSELSGGQQQRVAIARALAKSPEVLLLDEPLSNLDAKLRVEMREEIHRIQREAGITTIFVTHDQEEASAIADEIVLLKSGQLQQMGSARNLYDEPCNYFVADFLGSPPINKLHGTIEDGKFRFCDSELVLEIPMRCIVESGTAVTLAVRAESVMVPAGEQQLPVIVRERYTINKDELAVLEIEGQFMRGFISGEYPVRLNESLTISFNKRGVFLFDAQTGERLA